ncbi:hypothetical protein H6A23_04135 [Olsenella uli]|uniref:anti-sigma-I factor RsgI family protein n=1 Tax=Olsenella uli TaxID=133926 RepID=UPI001959ADDD|nr:hypothetical protein [Olsenella uli]MBM6816355.1 hypothetical protein [Olsenella uli]
MREGAAERRVREAFASVHAPEDVKARALAAIEARRAGEPCGDAFEPPAPAAAVAARRPSRPRARGRARLLLAACLVVAVVGVGLLGLAFVTPSAYVDIDVNPSIELAVNRFDRVVGARGLNEDGRDVLAATDVTWMGYEQAVAELAEGMEAAGYLGLGSTVSVTVSCDDDAQYGALEDASHRCLGASAAEVSCSHASEEERHAAHEEGLGVGKWRVWRELVDAGSDLTAEDAAGMSVRELTELLEGAGSASGHHGGRHRGQAGHD